jgi:diacylglycerol kinase family enzyme
VVNLKARKVRQATLDMLSRHVDREDLFITRTVEQSDQSLDEVIRRRYPLVFCGGGDGTAMRVIEQVRRKVDAHNAAGGDYRVPRFGLLKLGTGNGWAGQLAVPPGVRPIWAVRQAMGVEDLAFANFHMIETDDRLFHFGGFGVDALVLNDYIDFKNLFSGGLLWKAVNSLAGYLTAILVKSIPKVLLTKFAMKIRVTNLSDEPVYRCAQAGIADVGARRGDVLYEGPAIMVGASTTPCYGFGLRVYPFALARRGVMQIRIADLPIPTVLAHVAGIWRGTWEHPGLHDLLVRAVRIEVEGKAPFQLGGDPEGYRSEVTLRLSDFTVDLLDFRAGRKELPAAAMDGR